ncbi:MAG: EAL domain-containing protein [Gammaproteobacteria bacterium]|nr:EAL domain-containing protein [Gammaproteobacteria bacterium]
MQIVTLLGQATSYFEVSVHELQAADAVPDLTPELNQELLQQKALAQGYVLVLRNVTQRRQLEQQLRQRAYTDALTGAMNRAAFEERLQALAARIKRTGGSHALAFVDLDQFKIVNDTAGHHAGDALLKKIADTLRNSVREGDIVARLGGDEFALLLGDCMVTDARRRCQQVCDAVNAINFSWETRQYPVSASFGVAMFDKKVDSVETLMGRADAACYVVKDQGRNGVHMWTEDNVDSGRQFTDMNWVSRLQSALNEQRILIFAQQIWDLSDRTGYHLEVLISLRDVDGTLVSPVEFIPAAERYGLMPSIDHYVMEAVFKHIGPLQEQLLASNYRIAINLSGHTIGSEAALNEIRKLFHRYNIEPSLICFEITETAALQNMADAQRFLMALKELGCQLALDDFGTGFSSFSYLKSLPVDLLKIDGEFVREMLHKETDHAIVEGIHRVGHTMGLKTVAECVENADVLRELRAIGVTYGQGMFLSKRRPLKEIISKQTLAIEQQPLLRA